LNKIILYVGLAILLGTVTMVAPLALLQEDNPFSDNKFVVQTTSAELEDETRGYTTSNQTLGLDSSSENYFAPAPEEPTATDSEVVPKEPITIVDVTSDDSGTDLSPVALITVPSFIVALVVFVFLRRQAA